jgi:hypothetical protein
MLARQANKTPASARRAVNRKTNMPRKIIPGPFIILGPEGEPLRDVRGAVREFSTVARANSHVRPGDKVVSGKR